MSFEKIEIIGEGGFGSVYKAWDTTRKRDVALKFFKSAGMNVSGIMTHATALARVSCPNVITVHQITELIHPQTHVSQKCIVMEYFPGVTLENIISKENQISMKKIGIYIECICKGLSSIHKCGYIHGDLHTENILVNDENVKIIDILNRNHLESPAFVSSELLACDLMNLINIIELMIRKSDIDSHAVQQTCANLKKCTTVFECAEFIAKEISASQARLDSKMEIVMSAESHEDLTDSAEFFQERFKSTFPGVRGMRVLDDPREITNGICRLLRQPLRHTVGDLERDGLTKTYSPIWWWRGSSNMYISSIEMISDREILIDNIYEYKIHRCAAINNGLFSYCFLYVEFSPMSVTGVQDIDEGNIQLQVSHFGYATELYGLFKGKPILAAEHEDNYATIDGDIVCLNGESQIRMRYITPYNIIIAPQKSPINNNDYDKAFGAMMNGILSGIYTLEELRDLLFQMPKQYHNY